MDHSYSKGRDRVQKTDHCYFTVGKKTPQVVLRKAQHLKEQTHDSMKKTAVGQDHSYVRAEHVLNTNSFDCETTFDVESQTASDLCCASLFSSSVTGDYDGLSPTSPDKVAPQNNLERVSLTLEVDMSRQTAVEALLSLDCAASRCSVVDDLQFWIGSIQLDHAYGGSSVLSPVQDSNPCDADHTYESCIAVGSVSWPPQHHLDHAYDNRLGRQVSDEIGCVGCDQSPPVPPDAAVVHHSTCWEIEPARDELDDKQSCIDKLATDESSDSAAAASDEQSNIFHHYCDHEYEAIRSDPSNVTNEFQTDHSYGAKSSLGAYAGTGDPDWWDHAYVVDCSSSLSTIESCSYHCDVGLSTIVGWGIAADAAVGEALG